VGHRRYGQDHGRHGRDQGPNFRLVPLCVTQFTATDGAVAKLKLTQYGHDDVVREFVKKVVDTDMDYSFARACTSGVDDALTKTAAKGWVVHLKVAPLARSPRRSKRFRSILTRLLLARSNLGRSENPPPGHGAASSSGIERPATADGGGIALAHQLSSGLWFSPGRSSEPKNKYPTQLAPGRLSRPPLQRDGSL
jgi:hypothetical protein